MTTRADPSTRVSRAAWHQSTTLYTTQPAFHQNDPRDEAVTVRGETGTVRFVVTGSSLVTVIEIGTETAVIEAKPRFYASLLTVLETEQL